MCSDSGSEQAGATSLLKGSVAVAVFTKSVIFFHSLPLFSTAFVFFVAPKLEK